MDPNEFNKVENITNFFNINGINLMSLKLTSDITLKKCGKYEKNQHIAGLESTISPKQEFEFAMNE